MPDKLAGCKPDLARKVNAVIADLAGHGVTAVVIEGLRSPERQQELYAQGRTTPGNIVTKVKRSKHTAGEAADLWFVVGGKRTCNVPARYWDLLGSAAEAHGLVWGGRWRLGDKPHVELK